jgi:ABC-type lipoprotein release transport system permease subunit
MIWSISWKNIWRNKTRSLVILIAIALGLLAGIFSVGFMMGMVEQRISNSINNEVSHIQIHNPDFLRNDEIEFTINNPDKIISTLKEYPEVHAFTVRMRLNAMANTSGNNAGVAVYGVHPEQEKKVFKINENIIPESGSYLDDKSRNQMVIGEELAERLNIVQFKITDETIRALREKDVPDMIATQLDTLMNELYRSEGDFEKKIASLLGKKQKQKYYTFIKEHSKVYNKRSKIVLTMQDAEGNLTGGAFRIAGIYSIPNSAYEAMNVFVRYEDLARITSMDTSNVHEIALFLNDREQGPQVVEKLKSEFPDKSIQLWNELQPDLALTTEYVEISYYIIIIFILLALGFGIINTMLMAVLERIKELGMLMAIGMNKKRVFFMIMLETIYLTITGAVAGMALGYLLIKITGKVGIDLSMYAEGFQAIGYSTLVYPEITFKFFIGVTALVVFTGMISSIYPAIKALKLNPVEATRTE